MANEAKFPHMVSPILCHLYIMCVIFHHEVTMEYVTLKNNNTTSIKRRGRELSLCPLLPGLKELLVKNQTELASLIPCHKILNLQE